MVDSLPRFLGLPPGESGPVPARCRILPVPYEATVSYEGGAAGGPRGILEASAQVELYDRSFGLDVFALYGVETLPAFDPPETSGEAYVSALADHAAALHDDDRLLVGLGGEHTVTVGLARGTRRASGRPLTLVQIDAHADLRDEYQTDPYSHACVARRLLDDGVDAVVQLGIRSVCLEEAHVIDADPSVRVYWADQIHDDPEGKYLRDLSNHIDGRDVYLSIDVDGMDPAIVPATGTPEPNGLTWRQTIKIVRTVARAANVVGLDVVELAPRPGLHAADFAVAKLTYQTINAVADARGWLS